MNRTIDADALTKRFVEFCNKNCPYTAKARNVMCGSCFMGLALEAVEDAPTIESQRWIPCSERLPEVGTYVLVSKKPLSFRSNLPNVCMAHRSCDPRSGKEEWNDMLFGKLDDDDVLAWMPLPTPYREEGGKQ